MRDVDLIERLNLAENELLTSLLDGTQMLASYNQTWSTLPGELSTASQNGDVGHETLSLAHLVATRISQIATCFLDIRHDEEILTAQLQSDYAVIFHQMAALDLNASPKTLPLDDRNDSRSSRSSPVTPIPNAGCPSPSFLATAHQWLLDNLHSPYPSPEVKARMAAASSCDVSSINSWFMNARRRIGWTTLCREHFSNCRADTIDAAYRALVKEDPRRALSPGLQHLFVAMKVAAEDLCSSTLTRSTFSGDLDAIAKGITEEKFVEKCRPAEPTKAVKDSYPSPDSFVAASPVPVFSDSFTDENEEVAPSVIAGSKRPRSSIEPADQPSSIASRPIKRLRTFVTSQTCLPSPPSSTNGIHESSQCSSPELLHAHPTPPDTNEVLPSRKRRLSAVEDTRIPKRPRESMTVPPSPGLQTIPDPLPPNMENDCSIDDWFHANFDDLFAIPPPVEATAPDFSDAASWEVELFRDYSIPGEPKHGPERLSALTAATYAPSPSDLSDLDSLLQSIGTNCITPSATLSPPTWTATPYTMFLDSSIPDLSHTNLDWTSLVNCTETHQPTIYSPFPQCSADSQPLPEIDFSMLQLPQVIFSQDEPALKQAKLQRLQAMQEAVSRMEQELRSEGVVM